MSGELYLPPQPRGLVLFASNRDLMRLDRRQVDLGEALNRRGIGTLLFDLVETTDDVETENDLEVLTERLLGASEWSSEQWGVGGLPLGYVGSGLGSAAALIAAVALGQGSAPSPRAEAGPTLQPTGSRRSGPPPCS